MIASIVMTPLVPGSPLMKATKDEKACRSATVSIIHRELIVFYAVGTPARFSSRPNQTHWVATKGVSAMRLEGHFLLWDHIQSR